MWFPIDTAAGVLQNGVWEVDFGPYRTDRELKWIALIGPSISSVRVFLDTIFIDATPRGDINRADYPQGTPIPRGRMLRLVWSVGTGNAPTVSIGCTDGGGEALGQLTGNPSIFTNG